MKISFVVIAYNEEKNIANCINSILHQKNIRDYEIIVVNDGSKDKTLEIVKNLMQKNRTIKLVNLHKNKGRGNARHLGVKKAKGDYIAFVDSDIILPKHWSKTCLKHINKDFDAVGGIAVPDGDVNYIWRKCNLKPKIVKHTTEITGNNGLYKKDTLKNINFNNNLKDGEDFDVNERLKKNNFKLKSIKDLIVEHRESKSYLDSLKWLFQSGKGATSLLKEYKRVRLPDLAFFGFIFFVILSILELAIFNSFFLFTISILYPLLTGFLHIKSKFEFELENALNFILAVILDYPLIFIYYLGRIVGFK